MYACCRRRLPARVSNFPRRPGIELRLTATSAVACHDKGGLCRLCRRRGAARHRAAAGYRLCLGPARRRTGIAGRPAEPVRGSSIMSMTPRTPGTLHPWLARLRRAAARRAAAVIFPNEARSPASPETSLAFRMTGCMSSGTCRAAASCRCASRCRRAAAPVLSRQHLARSLA